MAILVAGLPTPSSGLQTHRGLYLVGREFGSPCDPALGARQVAQYGDKAIGMLL